jgi:hypothetical protein
MPDDCCRSRFRRITAEEFGYDIIGQRAEVVRDPDRPLARGGSVKRRRQQFNRDQPNDGLAGTRDYNFLAILDTPHQARQIDFGLADVEQHTGKGIIDRFSSNESYPK